MKSTFIEHLQKLDHKYVVLLGIMLYYAIYWGNFGNFTASIDHNNSLFPDFAEFYYPAGKAIIHNLPLPNSFYYSSFAALLFVPFVLFSLPTALILWGFIQLLFIATLFLEYQQKLPKNPVISNILTFIFFTSSALLNNLKWGQVSTPIFLGAFTAFVFYEQNKRTLSAAVLGALIAIKFFPAVFLAYFFFKKDWKYLFLCLLFATIFLLFIPSLILGWNTTIQSQFAISDNASTMIRLIAMDNIDSQYFASVITRILRIPLSSPVTGTLVNMGYLFVVFALFLVYRISKARIENSSYWAWGILSATIPFWIPSAWPHYFVYLPFLQTLALDNIRSIDGRWRKSAMILWTLSAILSSIVIVHIIQDWFQYVGFGSLLWSNLFVLILSAIIVLSATKQERKAKFSDTK